MIILSLLFLCIVARRRVTFSILQHNGGKRNRLVLGYFVSPYCTSYRYSRDQQAGRSQGKGVVDQVGINDNFFETSKLVARKGKGWWQARAAGLPPPLSLASGAKPREHDEKNGATN